MRPREGHTGTRTHRHTQTHRHTDTHTQRHTHTRTHACTHTRAHTHAHTQTHAHTHTHTFSPLLACAIPCRFFLRLRTHTLLLLRGAAAIAIVFLRAAVTRTLMQSYLDIAQERMAMLGRLPIVAVLLLFFFFFFFLLLLLLVVHVACPSLVASRTHTHAHTHTRTHCSSISCLCCHSDTVAKDQSPTTPGVYCEGEEISHACAPNAQSHTQTHAGTNIRLVSHLVLMKWGCFW